MLSVCWVFNWKTKKPILFSETPSYSFIFIFNPQEVSSSASTDSEFWQGRSGGFPEPKRVVSSPGTTCTTNAACNWIWRLSLGLCLDLNAHVMPAVDLMVSYRSVLFFFFCCFCFFKTHVTPAIDLMVSYKFYFLTWWCVMCVSCLKTWCDLFLQIFPCRIIIFSCKIFPCEKSQETQPASF